MYQYTSINLRTSKRHRRKNMWRGWFKKKGENIQLLLCHLIFKRIHQKGPVSIRVRGTQLKIQTNLKERHNSKSLECKINKVPIRGPQLFALVTVCSSITDEKQLNRLQLKLLPRSSMLFKMTIFWTIVIVTHVTVNWIVLRFPTTSAAGRRHIHCVYASVFHACSPDLSFLKHTTG